jgi:hypothetical protein
VESAVEVGLRVFAFSLAWAGLAQFWKLLLSDPTTNNHG